MSTKKAMRKFAVSRYSEGLGEDVSQVLVVGDVEQLEDALGNPIYNHVIANVDVIVRALFTEFWAMHPAPMLSINILMGMMTRSSS